MAKWLLVVVVVLFGAYGAYWYIGASAVERQTAEALEGLEEDGWSITYDSLQVRGFPNRFDTTLEPLSVVSPSEALQWTAPFLQVFALSYRPNEVIVVWPEAQELQIGETSVTLTSGDLRASAHVALGGAFSLEEARLVGSDLAVGLAAETGSAKGILFAVRESLAETQSYDLYLDVDEVEVPGLSILAIDIDVTAALSAPLDRNLRAVPQIEGLEIKRAELVVAEAFVDLTGELAPGADGFPVGRIDVRTRAPLELVESFVASGYVTEDAASVVRGTLGAAEPGPDGVISLTLRLEAGFATLGGSRFLRCQAGRDTGFGAGSGEEFGVV